MQPQNPAIWTWNLTNDRMEIITMTYWRNGSADHPDLKRVSGSDFHVMDNPGFGGIILEQQVKHSENWRGLLF